MARPGRSRHVMALGGSSRNSRIARCGQPCLPWTALLAGVQLLPGTPDLGIPRDAADEVSRGLDQFRAGRCQEEQGAFETLPWLSEIQFGPNHVSVHCGVGLALQRDGQSRELHEMLRRCQAPKVREDQTAGPRVALTTRPVAGLKRNDVLR